MMFFGGDQGAGLQQMAWSTLKTMNPYYWKKKIQQYRKNTDPDKIKNTSLSAYEKDMVQLAKNAYDPLNGRQNYNNYEYQPLLSSDTHAVYRNNDLNKNYLIFRGTASAADFWPDYSILTGYQQLNNRFSGALNTFNVISPQLTGEWETVGHSLGGTQAMYVAQQNNIQSHAFNPGYNNYTDDVIDTNYKKHNVYVKQGDLVSNSILTEELPNLKVLPSDGTNLYEHHTIHKF